MQPNYQPQYPQQPAAYPQPTYPPQAYPQAPQFPQQPQGYPQPYAQPQQPAAPLPTGSLDTFYQQPSASGGPSFKFMDANRQAVIGKTYEGFVARPITDADVRAQTINNQVQTYNDGRPKFVLVVPMLVQPSQEFPEGQAGWWVKGQARDELARAMAEAGAPAGAPEAGAWIRVTLVGTRPVPGYNPAFQYRVEYRRPQNAQAPQQAPAAPTAQSAAPQAPAAAPVVHQMAQPMPQPAPVVPPASAPQPVAQAAPAAGPGNLSPDQQALLAKLTGQQQTATA